MSTLVVSRIAFVLIAWCLLFARQQPMPPASQSKSAGGLPDDGHPFHSGEERVANYWGVDTVFAKHCGVTRDPWGLVLTRGSRPAEGCVLLKCRVPRAISRSSACMCRRK